MIASVHIADLGVARAVTARVPRGVDGLINADLGITAPLSTSMLPAPMPGRLALFGLWRVTGALGGGNPLPADALGA